MIIQLDLPELTTRKDIQGVKLVRQQSNGKFVVELDFAKDSKVKDLWNIVYKVNFLINLQIHFNIINSLVNK